MVNEEGVPAELSQKPAQSVSLLETVEAAALETLFDTVPELRQRAGDLAEEAIKAGLQQPEVAWKIAVTPFVSALLLGMDAANATPEKSLQAVKHEVLSRLSSRQAVCIDGRDEDFAYRFQNACYQLWEQDTDDEYIRTVSAMLMKSQSREQSERIGRAIWLAGFWKGWKLIEHGVGLLQRPN